MRFRPRPVRLTATMSKRTTECSIPYRFDRRHTHENDCHIRCCQPQDADGRPTRTLAPPIPTKPPLCVHACDDDPARAVGEALGRDSAVHRNNRRPHAFSSTSAPEKRVADLRDPWTCSIEPGGRAERTAQCSRQAAPVNPNVHLPASRCRTLAQSIRRTKRFLRRLRQRLTLRSDSQVGTMYGVAVDSHQHVTPSTPSERSA